eukprot:PhF_6_TR5653/c0_g2_i1/m.8281
MNVNVLKLLRKCAYPFYVNLPHNNTTVPTLPQVTPCGRIPVNDLEGFLQTVSSSTSVSPTLGEILPKYPKFFRIDSSMVSPTVPAQVLIEIRGAFKNAVRSRDKTHVRGYQHVEIGYLYTHLPKHTREYLRQEKHTALGVFFMDRLPHVTSPLGPDGMTSWIGDVITQQNQSNHVGSLPPPPPPTAATILTDDWWCRTPVATWNAIQKQSVMDAGNILCSVTPCHPEWINIADAVFELKKKSSSVGGGISFKSIGIKLLKMGHPDLYVRCVDSETYEICLKKQL